ncbi:MAG TPA: YhjD/YihY/BrkB family envelope integrity protein [Synergistaceae bacterium]|nr:YhjD/YihY/BrkB family envelope integrity protein [Synergistaceae bacterium]
MKRKGILFQEGFFLLVFLETLRRWIRGRTWIFAGGVAFYAVLSVLPVLLLGVFMLGWFVGTGPAREMLLQSFREIFGEEGWALTRAFLSAPHPLTHRGSFLSSMIFLVSLVLGATRFGVALRYSLEALWPPPESGRPYGFPAWLGTRLLSLILVVAGQIALFILPAWGFFMEGAEKILEFLLGKDVMAHVLPSLSFFADILGGFLLVAFILWGMYYGLPRFPVSSGEALAGALVGSGIFTLGKHAVILVIRKSLFSSLYGMVGIFMLFLLWIYFMAQVILFGAQYARTWRDFRYDVPFSWEEDV